MKEMTISAVCTDALRGMDLSAVEAALPGRAERARRFRQESDRLLCLGAGYLMMQAVGIRRESDLRLGEHGKPYAPGFPAFSISHSGIWCILASGDHRLIGADLEAVNRAHLDAAPAVYTPAELDWMAEDPLIRFFRLWTWKESVMKATGLGMSLEPGRFEVLPFARGESLRLFGRNWYAAGGSLGGYVFSVCADEPIGPLRWVGYPLS